MISHGKGVVDGIAVRTKGIVKTEVMCRKSNLVVVKFRFMLISSPITPNIISYRHEGKNGGF